MPEAGYFVVIDHSDGLHERVGNCRTDELKTVFFAFFGQRFRFQGFGGDLVVVGPTINQ